MQGCLFNGRDIQSNSHLKSGVDEVNSQVTYVVCGAKPLLAPPGSYVSHPPRLTLGVSQSIEPSLRKRSRVPYKEFRCSHAMSVITHGMELISPGSFFFTTVLCVHGLK